MPEKLIISVLEGRNLASKDSNGFSDPYVKIKLGKEKHQTKIIFKTLNPKYEDEIFTFDLTTAAPTAALHIECWDHDAMSSDDFMGQFDIPISEIQEEVKRKFSAPTGFFQKWYLLKPRDGNADGEIKGDLLLKFELVSQNSQEVKTSGLFFKWFPEIPHSETVIKEWLCAREGKIGLTTGHLFLTQNFICFNPSNHLVTSNTVVIPLKDVSEIKQRLSILLLPTGIEITSNIKKYYFSGFLHRNTVHRMLEAQWKNGNASALQQELEENETASTSDVHSTGSISSDISESNEAPPPKSSFILQIQTENTPELGLPDVVPITIEVPATVRDIFNKLDEKCAQDISIGDLVSGFELGIPKKKKGLELSINPMSVALSVGHTVTSLVQSGFATRRKLKLVLDESKPLSFYNIKAGDILVLRKKITTKTLSLKIEVPDKKDLISATYDSSVQIKNIMVDLGKKNNTEYSPEKFHVMLSKQGSRGVVLEPEGILGNYLITDQDIMRIKPSCPFTSVGSIYSCTTGELNEDKALYEFAAHCLVAPASMKKPDAAEAKALLQKIQARLEVNDATKQDVDKRLEAQKPFVTEVQLIELLYRLSTIPTHPFYKQADFEKPEKYKQWKETEKTETIQLANSLIFKPEVFFGMLTVTVLEANGLVAVDYSTGKSDPYCILEVDGVKQMTRARKRNLNPVWNETFVFGVQNADSKLQLTVMDQNKLEQDNFLAKLDVPLKDIANGIPVMGWFTLPTKGKIRLHMQFSHQFSKYISLLNQEPVAPPPPGVISINQHSLYKKLLQILIEFDNGEETILTANSKKLLDEYATRFGITQTSKLVLYMSVLAKQFKPNKPYIDWMEETLNVVDRFSPEQKTLLTKSENASLVESANALLEKLSDTVEQFKDLFPQNTPPGTLTIILESIGTLLELKGSEDRPSSVFVPAAKVSLKNRFDQLVREVGDKHPGQPFGVAELVELIEKIKAEHEEDAYFETDFPRDFDIVAEGGKLYLTGIQDRIAAFCATASYSEEALGLYFKVRDLEKLLTQETKRPKSRTAKSPTEEKKEKPVPVQDQLDLEATFKPIIYGWLKSVEKKLWDWCQKACDLDKGEPVGVAIKYSSSLVDVFSTCKQALTDLHALNVKDPFITVQFLEILSEIVDQYAKLQYQMILKPIDQYKADKKEDKQPFTFTPQMCVWLNNIDQARGQLDDLVSQVDPSGSTDKRASVSEECLATSQEMCVKNTFAHLKNTLADGQERFAKVMRDHINELTQSALLGVVNTRSPGSKRGSKSPPPNHTPSHPADPITQYLDGALEVLSDKLEDKLFQAIMKKLWDGIVADLIDVVLPKDQLYTLTNDQIKIVEEHLNTLRDYFHANGNGVALPHLDKHSSLIRAILTLYPKETQELLNLYSALQEKNESTEYPGLQLSHVIGLLSTRSSTDKEVKAILKAAKGKAEEDKKLREVLILPATETIIDTYVCTYEGKTGKMVLTSNYLCFDPIVGGGPDSEHQVALQFTELKAINKKRVMLVFAAIEVITDDNKTYLFSSFVDRDGALADIRLQITKKGNTKVVFDA